MSSDKIFSKKLESVKDFNFGSETAAVFDDMLDRSVPFYSETQRLITELAADLIQPDTNVYDLGCSTATTLIMLDKVAPANVRFVGLDYSQDMLDKAKQKLKAAGVKRDVELRCGDLNQGIVVENASLVIMNLTLQFVRPLYRDSIMTQIAQGLKPNGGLLLIEKVLGPASDLNRLFIKNYYEFKKRNGYSELEISQKREALENVLVPYRVKENEELMLRNGFREADIFFKWYNFCGFVAVK
jgi:tRNA (cmo5U34)-methyltransferase